MRFPPFISSLFIGLALFCGLDAGAQAATLTVTNLNDSGVGSLRSTIIAAAAGDTINFGVTGTIEITSAQLTVNKKLTIIGPEEKITIRRNTDFEANEFRIFNLLSGPVSLSNLALVDGRNTSSTGGGAIYSNVALTLNNCDFSHNESPGDGTNVDSKDGGAVYCAWGSSINATDCSFSNSLGYFGGALMFSGSGAISLTRCAFTDNTGYYGGAVNRNGSGYDTTLFIKDCTFSGNYVSGAGGGALWSGGKLNVTGTTFKDNTANEGGGIYGGGAMTISDCTFDNNTSYNSGGGIHYTGGGTLDASDCIFTGNHSVAANTYGGGIYNGILATTIVTRCTFLGNDAEYGGGALGNLGTLNVKSCTFANSNTADWGAAIYSTQSANNLTIEGSTFSGNTVRPLLGGAGGAIFNWSKMTVTNSTFSGNNGFHGAGAIFNATQPNNAVATIKNCTIIGNIAQDEGGGILSENGTLNLYNTIVAGNSAATGPDCRGDIISQDYNLVQNTAGSNITNLVAHNIYGQDAKLGPLQDNGGPTLTRALLAGSPAIDAGNSNVTTDQRGLTRPQGSADDIGAFETDAIKPTIAFTSPANNATLAISAFGPGTITGSANDNWGVSGVRVALSRTRNGAFQYWNGTAFTSASVTVPASLSGNGANVTWNLGSLTPPASQLDEGGYRVDAYALDAAGNKSVVAKLLFTLFRDVTVPTVTLSQPTLNQKILLSDFNGNSIRGEASDNVGVSAVKVRLSRKRGNTNFYWNGSEFVTTSSTVDATVLGGVNATWSLGNQVPTADKLDPGLYQVEAYALDAAGNKSVTVKAPFSLGTDFTLPSVSITSPSANQFININAFGAGTIQGLASDNSGVATVKLKLQRKRGTVATYWNGSEFTTAVATVDATVTTVGGTGVTWSLDSAIPASQLDSGAYTVYASAYDAVGNGITSPSRSFTITGTVDSSGTSQSSASGS